MSKLASILSSPLSYETHNNSQRYLSTRGGSYNLPFEQVVLKGLAPDGGLFIPAEIPPLPSDWPSWKSLSFPALAHQVLSLYISPSEIPPADLQSIIARSYSTFRHPDITPLVTLDPVTKLHLLELFHGPTFAFKDVALQFLGNLFEYFLVRANAGKDDDGAAAAAAERTHLTVIGATSGDTGSAAIYGLRGKRDVSVFILHPKGRISPIQEAQMTTVLDANVHNLAVEGTFDDCQDMVKALFADPEINAKCRLAAVNSINWARILAQMTYYFWAWFEIARREGWEGVEGKEREVRFVVPTGNFGDVLAGYYAKRMGLPISKLVIATNANDILHRFWQTGSYTKHAAPPSSTSTSKPPPTADDSSKPSATDPSSTPSAASSSPTMTNGTPPQTLAQPVDGSQAHPAGALETLSPAMDILVSSNFERLLWYVAYDATAEPSPHPPHNAWPARHPNVQTVAAGKLVRGYLEELKTKGGFRVTSVGRTRATRHFATERVSDAETVRTIRAWWRRGREKGGEEAERTRFLLDPHSAVGVTAAGRWVEGDGVVSSLAGLRIPADGAEKGPDEAKETQNGRNEEKIHTVALATAHPAKFAAAVQLALEDEEGFEFERDVLPEEFRGLEKRERRVGTVGRGEGWQGVRRVILETLGGGGEGKGDE